MYYYCNQTKMSASAAGHGVQGCGSGRPQSTSRRRRCGGGCGELVNGDGSSAAAAIATSATPVQCSDRESSVAEAQAFSEWDNATCIDADPARKKNKDGYFLNGTADITREGNECENSSKYGLGRFCAAGRQSVLPGEDNGINTDFEASGFQRGGERFMGALTRRGERRVRARLPSTRPARNRKGQSVRPETEEATMTAAARSEPVVTKRRGYSFTRASKRMCFSARRTIAYSIAYSDSSDAEDGIGSNEEAAVKNTAGGNSARIQTQADSFKDGYEVDSPKSQHTSSRRLHCDGGFGAEMLNFTACSSEMKGDNCGVSSINNSEQSTCMTSKERVRLYQVRSFLAGSSGHHNGVSEKGAPAPRRPVSEPGRGDKHHEHEQQRRCVRKAQCFFEHSSHNDSPQSLKGAESRTLSHILNGKYSTEHSGPSLEISSEAGGSELATSSVEAVKGEARRRQAELQERTDRLWRRLQVVQMKQVERHVTQQLLDLHRAPGLSCTRGPSAMAPSSVELSRLARSCCEVLRTAESALDSDHTASSSGGGSDSEEDEGEERGVRRVLPLTKKIVHMSREWQWMKDRALLGSRWVWLQTQVSELEYRIRVLTELYTHLQQGKVRATHSVPETLIRASKPSLAYRDCRSSFVGDPLRKRQMENPAPSTQTPPSPPSSAARVRPLLRQSRHQMIRIEGCSVLGSKAVTLACSCGPQTVCVLCACVPSHTPADNEQRVWTCPSTLDPCVHPVLSAPSDCPITLHCGTPLLVVSQNSMQWMGLTTSSLWLGRRGQGHQRVGRVRRRLVCPRLPSSLPPLFNMTGGSNCRTQKGMVSPSFPSQRVTDFSPLPATLPAADMPTQPLRRRRGESSFDIDNLVMPLGLSGLRARVQRLQYKEIITPSWRELVFVCRDSEEQPATQSHTSHQSLGDATDEDGEVEDLSDAVFLKRHAVCESRERNRWGSWAWRLRRGRDGKRCRALEQAPCSPDPRLGLFPEGEASPRSPLCSGADDPFYQMEDEQQSVVPWECRSFPLLEAELQWLQEDEEAEPKEDPYAASGRSQSTDSGISVGSLELLPRTPQPQQQKSPSSGTEEPGSLPQLTHKPATPAPASITQDSASLPPPSPSPSPPSYSTHATPCRHRVSMADARPL